MNNTLLKGLAVLEMLSKADEPMNLTQIANNLGVVKSNAHTLMRTLLEQRYVVRHNGGYVSAIKLWNLGSAVLSGLHLKRLAMPHMEALREETGERVHLSVLDTDCVVFVHKMDRPKPEYTHTQIGLRVPAHMLATGKVQLAFCADNELAALSTSLKASTSRTIVSPRDFFNEMKRVREDGFAVNRGEWREGVWGVAAPILDANRRVVGAIGFSGPPERIRRRSLQRAAGTVLRISSEISEGLGLNARIRALSMLGARPDHCQANWQSTP